MLRSVAPKKRRLVVHIGNVGLNSPGEIPSEKTNRYAKRFPGFDFIGIDPQPDNNPKPKNWKQLQEDAVNGLKQLEDNSVDIITSDIALGYYGKSVNPKADKAYGKPSLTKATLNPFYYKRHAAESLKLAFEKLKPGGKLMISVETKVKKTVMAALSKSGFEPAKIHVRAFTEKEKTRTFWTRYYAKRNRKLYQIIAQK